MATALIAETGDVGLYLDLEAEQLVDLEVAAAAAIEWSRALKAAGNALDPEYEYRVQLVAAEPGSSRWLAKIKRSKANKVAERIKAGWEDIPLLIRAPLALAVVLPVTAVPTYNYWTGQDGFSEAQKKDMEDAVRKAVEDPAVTAHRKAMYKEVQRDPRIKAVGGGVPASRDWKPDNTVPANQFAEAEGLFDLQTESEVTGERTIVTDLDVILVTPRLESAPRTWIFRQEGLPGTILATMRDKRFLHALEQSAVRETLRVNIPMKVRLQIKQKQVDGEWVVRRKGRSVIEVLSPVVR